MSLTDRWHVRSRAKVCSLTQKAFSDGEAIITALFVDPDPSSRGYIRKDYIEAAWINTPSEAVLSFSHWRTIYSPPSEKEDETKLSELSPEELLQRLILDDEDHTENTRYILAIMLERKKTLP